MNDHPHDLLAEYVDGALGPEPRASVEAHLSSCRSCSEEVELARHAREALSALPDVPAPTGIALEVRRGARRPSKAGRWVAAAAAAAVVAAGGLVLGRGLVGTGEQGADEGAGGGGGQAAPAAPEPEVESPATSEPQPLDAADAGAVVYFESDRNYDPASLAELTSRLRARAAASLKAGFAGTTERFFADLELDRVPPEARRAIRCASPGLAPNQPAAPFRIEAARFRGEPVYVAGFLRGPSPQARHDRVLIRVVSRDTCALRYSASQRL